MFSVLAFGLGTHEIIVIVVVAVLLFGATQIPRLGSAIGKGILNFKRGMREVKAEDEKAEREEKAQNADNSETPENKNTDS